MTDGQQASGKGGTGVLRLVVTSERAMFAGTALLSLGVLALLIWLIVPESDESSSPAEIGQQNAATSGLEGRRTPLSEVHLTV